MSIYKKASKFSTFFQGSAKDNQDQLFYLDYLFLLKSFVEKLILETIKDIEDRRKENV